MQYKSQLAVRMIFTLMAFCLTIVPAIAQTESEIEALFRSHEDGIYPSQSDSYSTHGLPIVECYVIQATTSPGYRNPSVDRYAPFTQNGAAPLDEPVWQDQTLSLLSWLSCAELPPCPPPPPPCCPSSNIGSCGELPRCPPPPPPCCPSSNISSCGELPRCPPPPPPCCRVGVSRDVIPDDLHWFERTSRSTAQMFCYAPSTTD